MDLYWPSLLCPSSSRIEIIDNAGKFQSPLSGFSRTVSRPGSRIRLAMNVQNLKDQKRAVMQSLIAALRGSDRMYSFDHSYVQRGSFPSAELLTNNIFADGTTGWTPSSEYTLSVSDQFLRAQRNAVTANSNLLVSAALTVVANTPYLARALVIPGQGTFTAGFTAFDVNMVDPVASVFGMSSNVHVPTSTSAEFRLRDNQHLVTIQGDYVNVPFVSYSRVALVDNGSNLLRHTQDMAENPSFWTMTASSFGDDATDAPDGTTTAESLIENTANSAHVTQASNASISTAAGDYIFAVALKPGSRTWARLFMIATGGQSVTSYFNLSTGAAGANSTGTSWSNLRTVSYSLGNSWRYIAIIARKTSAETQITTRIGMATADATDSYTGNGTGNIYIWRPTLAQSSLAVQQTNNGGVSDPVGSNNLAGGIYTKGWPVSTSGLLLSGDQIQIGDQLLIVTFVVNSDAAGRAFLQFAPSLRVAPADNAPIIINQPMGKFMLEPSESGWSNVPGIFSDSEIVLVESA